MNINEVLKNGREILETENIDPREARLLLAFVLKVRKEELLTIREITEEQKKEYQILLKRRVEGEPFAYLIGHKEFMKLDFKVNSNVLIPREDTEILVEEVIRLIQEKQVSNESVMQTQKIKILDLCTGSGCIAISLAKLLENVEVTALDISSEALEVAKENAKKNEAEIHFILSNLFEEVNEKYDVIVSNPPYIQTKIMETLQREVKKEPSLALDGGETGMDFYEKIIKEAPKFLRNNGILAFEIGYDQGCVVSSQMKENGFVEIEIKKDLGKQDRVVKGVWKQ